MGLDVEEEDDEEEDGGEKDVEAQVWDLMHETQLWRVANSMGGVGAHCD